MTVSPIPTPAVFEQATHVAGQAFVESIGDLCVVDPADARQAATLLRFADSNGLRVSLEGNGTKREWLDASPAEMLLRTRRMNRVLEHTWQDMTCTVESGCSWQALQTSLATHGQQVALDPLWPEHATVGGVIGANDSGSLRLRYGGLRDLVIGMTLVLADGTIARSGGKVVKNVAGYDLPKLLCGSFGTLALITEVTFRLHSIARHTSTLTARADNAEALNRLLLQILNSHFSVQSMQLRTAQDSFALDIRLAASPDVLASQQDGLLAVAKGMGLEADVCAEEVWATREHLFSPTSTVFKATVLPSAIGSTVQAIHSLGGNAVAQATGIITGQLPSTAKLAELLHLRSQLEAAGGSLTLLSAENDTARWGALPSSLPVMRAVKQHFDPNCTLNRGRFLGDL